MSRFFKPYEGNKPFLFISYSHRQSDLVVDSIRILHEQGWRLWYDEGIPAGSDWPANIARHMEACEAVLEYCFTMLGERRVWCAHYEDNDRSRRVIMKCGFLPMFTRLEWVEPLNEERRCRYYALTVEQWRVRHNTRSWRVKQ